MSSSSHSHSTIAACRSKLTLFAITLLLTCLSTTPSIAQEPGSQFDDLEMDALRLDAQLSSDDFADRQSAMMQLLDDANESAIDAATRSDDPEVRTRAKWIRGQWNLGIRSDTPPEVVRWLRDDRNLESVNLESLIAAGHLQALSDAVQRSDSEGIQRLMDGRDSDWTITI